MSIWNRYPDYTREELRTLVFLAAETLFESDEATSQFPPDFLMISPKAAAQQVQPIIQREDPTVTTSQIQRLLENEETSTELCLKVLDEIRCYPELANQLACAYERRLQSMATPELFLLTSALVILVLRLKKVSWQKSSKEITFYPSGKAVSSFIINLLSKIGNL